MSLEEAPIQSFVFEATARACASFDALTHAQNVRGNDDDRSQSLRLATFDNSSRFNIWVGEIGARYPGPDSRSADHRLRATPRTASRVLNVLHDLCETNNDLLDILLGHRQDGADAEVNEESDENEAFDFESIEKPISEAHELCLGVGHLITSLMKANVLVRKSSLRDEAGGNNHAHARATITSERYTQARESERGNVRTKAPADFDKRGTTAAAAVSATSKASTLNRGAEVPAERSRGDGQGSAIRVVEERRTSYRSEQRPLTREEATASRSRGYGQGSARHVVEERRPTYRPERPPPVRNEDHGRPSEQIRAARSRPEEPDESSSEESSNDEESSGNERSDAKAIDDIYENHTRSVEPYRHYVTGRVIERRLRQQPASTAVSNTAYAGTGSAIRRFVVVRSASAAQNSTFDAVPIKTYNGQGVAASGVIKAHHAVIYTMPIRPPAPRGSEAEHPQRLPGGVETGMQAQAILVIPSDKTRPLDPMSRLDFFDRQTFDINIADVRIYGRVEQRYVPILLGQYHAVWAGIQRSTGLPNPVNAPRAAGQVLTNTSDRNIVRSRIDQSSASGLSNTNARPSATGARVTTAQQGSAAGLSTTGAWSSGPGAYVTTVQSSSRVLDERVAQPTDRSLPHNPFAVGMEEQRRRITSQSQAEVSASPTTRSQQLTFQQMTPTSTYEQPSRTASSQPARAQTRVDPMPMNVAEISRVRQAVQSGVRRGQTQADASNRVLQQYLAAGHPRERAIALLRAVRVQAAPNAPTGFGRGHDSDEEVEDEGSEDDVD
ncbi:hypothetical protein LTR10_010610 [Elasticomyces elasticus]|nr:hypothetical protein LTR10_010610 [Elasticomyces elasticus]KAK4968216.1 hypothetical protein LTR42_009499 [Elasticomyces elasticus]